MFWNQIRIELMARVLVLYFLTEERFDPLNETCITLYCSYWYYGFPNFSSKEKLLTPILAIRSHFQLCRLIPCMIKPSLHTCVLMIDPEPLVTGWPLWLYSLGWDSVAVLSSRVELTDDCATLIPLLTCDWLSAKLATPLIVCRLIPGGPSALPNVAFRMVSIADICWVRPTVKDSSTRLPPIQNGSLRGFRLSSKAYGFLLRSLLCRYNSVDVNEGWLL